MIDLSKSSPFINNFLQEPKTEAISYHGVIYCNGQDKGTILNVYLEYILYPNIFENQAHYFTYVKAPSHIYFIDDRSEHVLSVYKHLSCAKLLNISCTFYQYCPHIIKQVLAEKDVAIQHPHILNKQINHFLHHQIILTNRQAFDALLIQKNIQKKNQIISKIIEK